MIEVLKEIARRRKLENDLIEEHKHLLSKITNREELFSLNCLLSSSKFSVYPETLIIKQMNGKRNKRSSRNGDFYCEEYGNVEYKYSNNRNRGKNKEIASFLQIRPKHDIDYYIFDYYDGEVLHTFLLNKEQLNIELVSCHYTHGCKDEEKNEEFTISLNIVKFEEWKVKYLKSI